MSSRVEYNLRAGREVTRRDYKRTTRLWARCPRCKCTWGWNGLTENVGDAEASIESSACACHPLWGA